MKKWYNKPPESKEAAKNLLSLSLEDKLVYTCANISDWDIFTNGNWYISFSGGKDSTVLLYIVAKMMNKMPVQPHSLKVLFCDTGLEFPEIRKFVPWYIEWLQNKFPNIVIDYTRKRPKKYFFDVIYDYGYPVISKVISHNISQARFSNSDATRYLRIMGIKKDGTVAHRSCSIPLSYQYLLNAPFLISSLCCDHTKKNPADCYAREKNLFTMTAQMASESDSRYRNWIKNGCNMYEMKHAKSNPMSFWKEQDVLQYIKQENIPVCSVYGDIEPFDGDDFYKDSLFKQPNLKCTGCQRTGCIFCAFGVHLEKGENRFQRLKRTHPKHWDFCINGGEWDQADGMWKPSKTPGHIGLGMGHVLDFIGVPYE